MSIKSFTVPALLLSLAAAGFNAQAIGPKADARPEMLGPTVTLSLTRADGYSMNVTVDGGGGFRDALMYAPAGYVGDFSFDSHVMVNLVEAEATDIRQTGQASADSRFSNEGLDIRLRQSLTEGPLPGSFLLIQSYRITNPAPVATTVNLYRYQDSDLRPALEGGYIRPGSRYAYLVGNLAPTPDVLTEYVGMAVSSREPVSAQRVMVNFCCEQFEVPPELDRTVSEDFDSDGRADDYDDNAISRRATLSLQPGQSTVITTKTLMGATALRSLEQLPTR